MLLLGALLVEFLWMDWSLFIFVTISVFVIIVAALGAMYIQRISKPHCKKCGHPLELKEKELLSQDEEIVRGRFVFIYKYAYEFNCPSCHEVVHVNKTVKK